MTERLPPPAVLTADQAAAASAFEAARGRPPFGPFATLLHSPELMLRAGSLGEYLRYGSSLPPRLSEFAILVVARAYDQPVEWAIHQPIALAAGVSSVCVDAIGAGLAPAVMASDEAALHAFCSELIETRKVSDGAYAAALAAFGELGVMDLVGLIGYYALLAMAMNVAGTAAPDGPQLP